MTLLLHVRLTGYLMNLTAKAGMDRIGSETTSSLKLQFEQKF